MKKALAILLSCSMILTGCSIKGEVNSSSEITTLEEIQIEDNVTEFSNEETPKTIEETQEEYSVTELPDEAENQVIESTSEKQLILNDSAYIESLGFTSISDPDYLSFIEDSVYADLVTKLDSEKYFVENVEVKYISKDYLEEIAYNSQENIYFGYNISDLNAEFEGEKFIFTLDDAGKTSVQLFEEYDDTYDKVLRNVAIGTGVILLCVTVSVVTGGIGTAPAVSMIFAASAKGAAIGALTGGAFNGATTFMTSYAETGNVQQAAKDSLLSASDGYMWGAIGGAVTGGTAETFALKGATANGLTMNQAAKIQKQSKLPLNIIKSFHSEEEADILIKAGLTVQKVNGKPALVREIDWNLVDDKGRTNLQRVLEKKLAPIGTDGKPLELHHIGQKTDTPLAILTNTEHHAKENYAALHYAEEGKDITQAAWEKQKKEFWKALAEMAGNIK